MLNNRQLSANKICISFHKKIYSQSAISEAQKMFSDFAEINYSQNQRYFRVNLRSRGKRNRQALADEFANAVLAFTKIKASV